MFVSCLSVPAAVAAVEFRALTFQDLRTQAVAVQLMRSLFDVRSVNRAFLTSLDDFGVGSAAESIETGGALHAIGAALTCDGVEGGGASKRDEAQNCLKLHDFIWNKKLIIRIKSLN